MDFSTVYRNVMLTTANAPLVRNILTRYGWRLGVGRFVAGQDLESALPALRTLRPGLHTMLSLVPLRGRGWHSLDAAAEA